MRERLTFEREIQDLDLELESPFPAEEPLAVPPSGDKSAALLKKCEWNIAPSNPVPFADSPPMGSYWPLITSRPKKVSYVSSEGKCNGVSQKGLQFLADRSNGKRYHVGVDLLANEGDKVVACEKGLIVEFHKFYTAKSGEMTYRLLIEHSNVVINYGEVKKTLARHPNNGDTSHIPLDTVWWIL